MFRGSGLSTLPALLAAGLLQPVTARAQFDTFPGDARSDGMGAAFTAVAEGAAAGWWNPAAWAFGPGISILPFSYADLKSDGQAVAPLYRGYVSPQHERFLWTSACAARVGPGGAGLVYQQFEDRNESSAVADEDVLRSLRWGAGIDFLGSVLPESERFRWALGANAKWFERTRRSPIDPAGSQGSAYDADLGMTFAFRRRNATAGGSPGSPPEEVSVRAGFVLLNAFDHTVDVPNGPSEPLGRAWRAGLATAIAGGSWTVHGPRYRILVAMDWLRYFGRVQDPFPTFDIGGELWLYGLIALRAGGLGSYGDRFGSGSFGFGADTGNRLGRLGLQVDYAILPGYHRKHLDAAIHWRL